VSIRERAVFSGAGGDGGYLQEIDDVTRSLASGETDPATARLQLKRKLMELGYQPKPAERGGIKDFGSDRRTNLVIETNVSMAQGYGQWSQGQDGALLDEWPGARALPGGLPEGAPRNWPQRWRNAGGHFFNGRMIALKNTEVWIATRGLRFRIRPSISTAAWRSGTSHAPKRCRLG